LPGRKAPTLTLAERFVPVTVIVEFLPVALDGIIVGLAVTVLIVGIAVPVTVTVADVTPAFTGNHVLPPSVETLMVYVRVAAVAAPKVSVAVPPVAVGVKALLVIAGVFPVRKAPTLTFAGRFVPVTVIVEFLLAPVAATAIVVGLADTLLTTGKAVPATVTVVVCTEGMFWKVVPPSKENMMVYSRGAVWAGPKVRVAVPPVALAFARGVPLLPPTAGVLGLLVARNAPTVTVAGRFVPVTVITESLLAPVAVAAIVVGAADKPVTTGVVELNTASITTELLGIVKYVFIDVGAAIFAPPEITFQLTN